jgi:YidC/Oxa1 family membrane protein insertase
VHLLLASSWLDPIVNTLWAVTRTIDIPVRNLGWSLIVLAAAIRLLFWPLNTAMFKSMLNMQKIAPQLKKLQTRYKDDHQKLQQEMMALYKQHNVNPLAGCWPMLVQYPIIISVYYVVLNHKQFFMNQDWLWIGSALSHASPSIFGVPVLAASLAHPDLVLILLYAASMYFSVRFGSMPATDPQQAQTQKMMAIVSPLMLGFLGWKYQWPSAMVLYWFAYNAFTMGQTFYLLRRFHEPLSFADSAHLITEDVPAAEQPAKALPAAKPASSVNGTPARPAAKSGSGRAKKRR